MTEASTPVRAARSSILKSVDPTPIGRKMADPRTRATEPQLGADQRSAPSRAERTKTPPRPPLETSRSFSARASTVSFRDSCFHTIRKMESRSPTTSSARVDANTHPPTAIGPPTISPLRPMRRTRQLLGLKKELSFRGRPVLEMLGGSSLGLPLRAPASLQSRNQAAGRYGRFGRREHDIRFRRGHHPVWQA